MYDGETLSKIDTLILRRKSEFISGFAVVTISKVRCVEMQTGTRIPEFYRRLKRNPADKIPRL